MRKLANKILIKVKEKTLSDLENKVASLETKLEDTQNENNRLIRELIIEQRQREAKDLHGGLFQISSREVATRIFNGLIMYLDPNDIAVVPHIILEGIWESQITKAWLSVINKPNAVVFDVGANFGYFGMLAAQNLDKKKAKVMLFEANPNLLPYINKTLSVNWLNENTRVEGIAVSDAIGTAQLNVLEDYTGSSSMHSVEYLDSYLSHKMQIKAEKVINVKTVTIDDYCAKNNINHIDIMKMDIEGYEEKAYEGMRKTVKKSPEMILFVEFTKDGYQNPKKYYNKMLQDFGHVYTIGPEGEFVLPSDTSYEEVAGNVDDWIMLVFSQKVLEHVNLSANV
jgi:FkbM family methyltransferase